MKKQKLLMKLIETCHKSQRILEINWIWMEENDNLKKVTDERIYKKNWHVSQINQPHQEYVYWDIFLVSPIYLYSRDRTCFSSSGLRAWFLQKHYLHLTNLNSVLISILYSTVFLILGIRHCFGSNLFRTVDKRKLTDLIIIIIIGFVILSKLNVFVVGVKYY